jgi:hypothetical protein
MTAPSKTYERGILNGTTEEPKQGIYEISSTQNFVLGTRLALPDGRAFRYAQAGAVALVTGNILSGAAKNGALTTIQEGLAVATSGVIGDPYGYATIDTTAQVADTFRDGYFCVQNGSEAQGRGSMYRIGAHGALAVESSKIPFADETLRTATLASTSTIALIANPYKSLVQAAATTAVGGIMGGAHTAVTASNFFWCQTWGPFNALINATLTVGRSMCNGVAIAGAVTLDTAALDDTVVGYSIAPATDTENAPIFLTLAP